MILAKIVSTRSTCNSRPTGAVIVKEKHIISTGYNGAMPGVWHCTDQPDIDGEPFCFRRSVNVPDFDKYNYCRSSHAEANAIAHAARLGVSIEGASVYCTLAPCYVCLKLIASSGIKTIYYEHVYESKDVKRDEFWAEGAKEAGIICKKIKIHEHYVMTVMRALMHPTSRRRLKATECIAPEDLEKIFSEQLTLDTIAPSGHGVPQTICASSLDNAGLEVERIVKESGTRPKSHYLDSNRRVVNNIFITVAPSAFQDGFTKNDKSAKTGHIVKNNSKTAPLSLLNPTSSNVTLDSIALHIAAGEAKSAQFILTEKNTTTFFTANVTDQFVNLAILIPSVDAKTQIKRIFSQIDAICTELIDILHDKLDNTLMSSQITILIQEAYISSKLHTIQ